MFSVIVLHHNKADYSQACLQSLLHSTARPLQVINVDNGSRDTTPQILAQWEQAAREAGIQVETLTYNENIGAVRGRNEALAHAEGEFIAFLDNDTILHQPDWLEQLQDALESHSNCGIVAPCLLFPWAPFVVECCGCAISPSGRVQYLERGHDSADNIAPREIQCAISAAWLMKREIVERIGLLDEAFSPVQYEDLDFCYRAREAGYSVWTAPHVKLYHFEHTTTAGSDDINFKYVTAKNGILFKKRWGKAFVEENATSEEATQWQTLPKKVIEEVNWRALLP